MANPFVRSAREGILLAAATLIFLSTVPEPVAAQRGRIVIKMASLAPQNSPWDEELQIMAQRWREASGGLVQLQIIPGAAGGEERDVIRKMRNRTFQAGTFSLAGLQNLTPSCVVLAIPLLAKDQDDLHRIRAALAPKIEEVFEDQGFVTLHWADLGWMRFFTPDPDASPDAVRSYTYVQWGDDSMSEVWREAGFKPGVTLNMADILMGLERGTVEAINTAPLVVGGYMWFEYLPYMIDIPWAPLSGATLIDKRVWESIPEDLRPELLRIARETGENVQTKLLQWEADVIRQMTEQANLTVITPEPSVMAEWEALFEKAWDMLRGTVVPEDWFAEAERVGREGGSR